jgi:hypothetical protein
VIFRPDIVEEAKVIVHHIHDNLKAVKLCQGTYANKRHQPLEYEVGNHVYLRVLAMKGVKRFGMKGKLAPRYIRPFPILEKYGTVAYKLDLQPSLDGVHDIFHVSQMNKCLKAPMDFVLLKVTPLKADLSYPEHPIKVFDQKTVSRGIKQSSSSRYNGATIPKKKQLGIARTFFVLIIQTSCCHSEEMCDCSLFLLEPLLLPNHGARFLLGGSV